MPTFQTAGINCESGHWGEATITGFAIRGKELVVHVIAENPEQIELRARLGKPKMGKSCLHFKRRPDLDAKALEDMIAGSVAEVRRRYLHTPGPSSSRLNHRTAVI